MIDILVSAATNSQPDSKEDQFVPMLARPFKLARETRNKGKAKKTVDAACRAVTKDLDREIRRQRRWVVGHSSLSR